MKCAVLTARSRKHLLRAELIFRMKRGDSNARRLLGRLALHEGESAAQIVNTYRKAKGPLFLERLLFYMGMLCLATSIGFCFLTASQLVPVEWESLLLCVGAFFLAQLSFFLYGRLSQARFFADGFARVLADIGMPS